MFKIATSLLIAFLIAIEPLAAGLSIRFNVGDRHRHRHHRHHQYHYNYPYYYNSYYYDNYNYYEFQQVASARVVDTHYTRHNRILTLKNGMRFKIRGTGYDWTGYRARIYRKLVYDGYNYYYTGYWLVIEGYEYRARRID